jgi:hypothetical protein
MIDNNYDEDLNDLCEAMDVYSDLNVFIDKIKSADDYSECMNIAATIYGMGYLEGFEAGKLEGKED